MINKDFRVELSFKSLNQLEKQLLFCIKNNIFNLNIPCKSYLRNKDLIDSVKFIKNLDKRFDIIPHYSLFYQYELNIYKSYQKLSKFLAYMNEFKIKELLLVSGTNKKKNFDTLDVLSSDLLMNNKHNNQSIGIAYNPYFTNNNKSLERERFLQKIKNKNIHSIWLQFGTDTTLLDKEITFLNKSIENIKNKVKIYGSFFIPSKQFIARFKFRPWKGVFIKNEYLNSIYEANAISREISAIYNNNNIIHLIESSISSDKDMENFKQFM